MAGKEYCTMLRIICVFIFLNTLVHGGSDIINITLVDRAVEKGAVCLDGSPAGYFLADGSGEGANNWIVYLQGGGWCNTIEMCYNTSQSENGSTRYNKSRPFGGILTSNQTVNPDFFNWNRVSVRYCDGSSFLGNVSEPVFYQQNNLYLRGGVIFRAVVDDLLAKGMKISDNVILVGGSAGGLATIHNCDRFRASISANSRLKCIADAGFFIYAKDFFGDAKRNESFAKIVALHELNDSLPIGCRQEQKEKSSLCFFPEYVVGHIQTPLFLLNSDFDSFQIQQKLEFYSPDKPWPCLAGGSTPSNKTCTPCQYGLIKGFQTEFLKALKNITDSPSRGLFITSCYIHGIVEMNRNWNGVPILRNKTIAQAIGDWYFDRSSVKEIDYQNQDPIDCS